MADATDDFFKDYGKAPGQYDQLGGHTDDSEWALIRKLLSVITGGQGLLFEKTLLERFRSDLPGQRWPNLAWLHGQVSLQLSQQDKVEPPMVRHVTGRAQT